MNTTLQSENTTNEQAVNSGTIETAQAFTTDLQSGWKNSDLAALEDALHDAAGAYPTYLPPHSGRTAGYLYKVHYHYYQFHEVESLAEQCYHILNLQSYLLHAKEEQVRKLKNKLKK